MCIVWRVRLRFSLASVTFYTLHTNWRLSRNKALFIIHAPCRACFYYQLQVNLAEKEKSSLNCASCRARVTCYPVSRKPNILPVHTVYITSRKSHHAQSLISYHVYRAVWIIMFPCYCLIHPSCFTYHTHPTHTHTHSLPNTQTTDQSEAASGTIHCTRVSHTAIHVICLMWG